MSNNRHVSKKQKIEKKIQYSWKIFPAMPLLSNKTTRLPELPTVLQDLILDYVDHTDETFNSTTYSPKSAGSSLFENRLPVFTLLQHAVRGEYKEVNAMLTKNPLLLLEKDTVTDYSGRKHGKRTVYQIALGAYDYHVKLGNGKIDQKGMVEMIAEHFKKLPGKSANDIKKIMQDQYKEQFPDGYEKDEAKRLASDLKAIIDVIYAIDKASDKDCRLISSVEDQIHAIMRKGNPSPKDRALQKIVQSVMKANSNEDFETAFNAFTDYLITRPIIKSNFFNVDLLKAFYQFRNHFEPRDIQKSGKHFNHQLLAYVAQLYDDNYEHFGNRWDKPKNIMCWQKVFGFFQRLVPACDAQIISQGIWSVVTNGDKSHRSLKFTYGGGVFFPLDANSSWEIGHNYAASGRGGAGAEAVGAGKSFQNLYRAKTATPALMQHPDRQQQKNHCVIL